MRCMESCPSIEAAEARARVPMKGSKRSEPKSMVKKTPASMKLTSTPEAPCRSYLARMASSASTLEVT